MTADRRVREIETDDHFIQNNSEFKCFCIYVGIMESHNLRILLFFQSQTSLLRFLYTLNVRLYLPVYDSMLILQKDN